MAAPQYALTNYFGTAQPADDILALIEAQLSNTEWTFVEQVAFTQASTNRVMRVWKNPASLNASGADFYIGFVKNAVAGTYLAARAFEVWNTSTKVMTRPVLSNGLNLSLNFQAVAFGNGQFVGVSSTTTSTAVTSPDGVTWTSRLLPSAQNWTGVAYGNGTWVAITATTFAATSTDGITWTARTLPTSNTWSAITYGAGLFVVVGQGGNTTYLTSPDGITWTQRTTLSLSISYYSIIFANGLFVASGGTSASLTTSPDGITWTSRTLPASGQWTGLSYGNGTYVALSATTTAAYSTNGTTWTSTTFPSTVTGVWSTAYGNSTFVAVTSNASSTIGAFTSPDGITWSNRTGFTNTVLVGYTTGYQNGIAFGAGTFATVMSPLPTGSPNGGYTTADGITWTPRGMGILSTTALTDYATTGATTPLQADVVFALAASTSYDVGVLVSKSYLVVNINVNGTTTTVVSLLLGLFSPAYSDAQITNPPLVLASGGNGSTSRAMRVLPSPNGYTFNAVLGPESILIGSWSAATKDAVAQIIRGSRVAVVTGTQANGYSTNGGLRGWLYDCIAVATVNSTTVKVGDTVTIGGTTWTALGQGSANATLGSVAGSCAYFYNVTSGS